MVFRKWNQIDRIVEKLEQNCDKLSGFKTLCKSINMVWYVR